MDENTMKALTTHLNSDVMYPTVGSALKKVCDNWSDVPNGEMLAAKLSDEKTYNNAGEVMADLGMKDNMPM